MMILKLTRPWIHGSFFYLYSKQLLCKQCGFIRGKASTRVSAHRYSSSGFLLIFSWMPHSVTWCHPMQGMLRHEALRRQKERLRVLMMVMFALKHGDSYVKTLESYPNKIDECSAEQICNFELFQEYARYIVKDLGKKEIVTTSTLLLQCKYKIRRVCLLCEWTLCKRCVCLIPSKVTCAFEFLYEMSDGWAVPQRGSRDTGSRVWLATSLLRLSNAAFLACAGPCIILARLHFLVT